MLKEYLKVGFSVRCLLGLVFTLPVSIIFVFILCLCAELSLAVVLEENYMQFNPEVVLSQDNGGGFPVGTSFSGAGTWETVWPELLVSINSNTYGSYSTLAVNQATSKRYGQIMVTLGKDRLIWVRLGLFDYANPQFTSREGSVGAMADVIWHTTGELRYFTADTVVTSGVLYSTTDFHDLTINYDLLLDTYDIWYEDSKIAEAVPFDETTNGVFSIGLGAAYWGPAIAVLKYWHWEVSDDTPFVSAGVAKSGFQTCANLWQFSEGLPSDLNHDCYVNLIDIAVLAGDWLRCNDPGDSSCE